jgi:hypothetical protein
MTSSERHTLRVRGGLGTSASGSRITLGQGLPGALPSIFQRGLLGIAELTGG